VQREKRQSGHDVWIFRWREVGPDGIGKQRKTIVGTIESLATEAAALKAAHALRIDANQQTPLAEGGPKTIAELIAHYRLKELAGEKQGRKAFSTRAGYESYLKGWIVPRWGDLRIDQIKSVAVEEWLGSIKRARGTRAKIRNIMSGIFHHAMRYEWVERNPIKLVRQSAKRERTAVVIGSLLAYASQTNTRSLALVADPHGVAYEILFSFHSPEEKSRFLELIRSNQELGNEYIEDDLMTPTVEEMRDARPLATVLPQRVMARATLVATTFCFTLLHDLPN
jgi:hypothetical protein